MKNLLIFKLVAAIFFFISVISFTNLTVQALNCADVAPQFTNFEDEYRQCIQPYESCVADKYEYDVNSCVPQCEQQYPGRINRINAEGCMREDYEEFIMYNFENEFSTKSAQYLVGYCDCINACAEENKQLKDIVLKCEQPLAVCCKNISTAYNPNYSPTTTESADPDTENYFTITSMSANADVEIIRAGSDMEDAIPAKIGMKLLQGDILETGYKSTAVLTRSDYATLSVLEQTFFMITEASVTSNLTMTQIELYKGEIISKVVPEAPRKAKFEIKTITATIGVRGTIFSVSYDELTAVTKAVAYQNDIYANLFSTDEIVEITEGNYIEIDPYDDYVVAKIDPSLELTHDELMSLGEPGLFPDLPQEESNMGTILIVIAVSCFCLTTIIVVALVVYLLYKKRKVSKV